MVGHSSCTDGRSRHVLEGVPRVAFYGDMVSLGVRCCPEDMPLPACLRSLAHYRRTHARNLARPEARQQIVALIWKARAQDEEALSHLERVLQG